MRETSFGTCVDTLVARGLLKPGLDPTEATDVLLTVAGSNVFLDFTEDRGGPVERYIAWTVDVLRTWLLADRR